MKTKKITWVRELEPGMEPPFLLSITDNKHSWHETAYHTTKRRIRDFWYYGVKTTFQRITRKTGTSDYEAWNLDGTLSKIIYPKLLQFYSNMQTGKFHGHPSAFSEYNPDEDSLWGGRAGYDAKVASGEIIGGGFERWKETIAEMLYAFKYSIHHISSYIAEPDQKKFYLKYFGELPDDEKEANINKTYYYYMHKCPKNLSPWCTCGEELTPDRCEKYGETLYAIEEYYMNWELIRRAQERAHTGMALFGKFFFNLWD